MTEAGCTITRAKRHMNSTQITAEDYLRDEKSSPTDHRQQKKLNELVYHFPELYKHEKSKENATNKSGWIKSIPTSEHQITQLLRSTDHQDHFDRMTSSPTRQGKHKHTTSKH